MRAGWISALDEEPDFIVLGDYESCEEAFASEDFFNSDVVLMDVELPGMSGIEGVKHITDKHPNMTVIMTTIHDDDQTVFDAICGGAVGYLVKQINAEELVRAIGEAKEGGSPMSPNIARKVISTFQRQAPKKDSEYAELTETEESVLKRLAEGKSYASIAGEMFLSVDGVRYHIRHIYEKLHVKSRGEAVAEGLKKHLFPPIR